METTNIIMLVVWLVAIVVAVIVELHTNQLIGWAAVVGAVAALGTSFGTESDPIWIEVVVFFSVWVASWGVFFMFFKRVKKAVHDTEDGYLDFIGKEFVAHDGNEEHEYGEIKVNDKFFRFSCDDKVKKGDIVVLERIKGVTWFVTLKESK